VRKHRSFKYYNRQVHLWLGLASGLVVFIVSITGCIFVFQEEISKCTHPEWYYIPAAPQAGTHALSLSRLGHIAQAALGADKPINNIVTYRDPKRSWEFMVYKDNDSAITMFGSMVYFQSVFLDPYTGEVIGARDYKYDFFNVVKYIHWSLLLNTRYGQPIVGWGTAIFVLLLITGLVLWWPKKWTKRNRDISFKIKWKASFRRVNYDLHNVPGFYSLVPAIVIGCTGLVMAFPWFSAFVYLLTTGSPTPPPEPIVHSVVRDSASVRRSDTPTALDKAFVQSLQLFPRSPRIAINPPGDAAGAVVFTGYRDNETYYGYDVLQFDQYNGRLLLRQKNAEKKTGQKLMEMNYDIHVGAIGGLTGKIIAFIVSLICASLPVTGFLVWWLKRGRGIKIA
jgi:uncharacterized iron-regulated membrane protein